MNNLPLPFPFHTSAQEAQAGTERKWRNLKGKTQSNLNFGGHAPELWCEGGELTFIKNMISESQQYSEQVNWFTSLVSKSDNLNSLEKHAKDLGVTNWKVVDMEQGSKQSRFVAWNWSAQPHQKDEVHFISSN
ncbi:RlmF-related methyltransferase (plasmid) [Pseudoalteromonas xiamenensis]|uniref:RlmF-related methyltransferase n=1 Tax=Pseudoalteromonas xiamenensis TaxID=882626 RepID=UPI0027E3D147|nr:RlmF-related methyltransferase [Pseudoalteromonas xiamenensis]WMN61539.1 RlmF-related methyltransferase [Pseudoalteromonas xiamenensis]WMN62247.1 RlmF-related methyltransferase [Pseudoalteromonas xiamenensis]